MPCTHTQRELRGKLDAICEAALQTSGGEPESGF